MNHDSYSGLAIQSLKGYHTVIMGCRIIVTQNCSPDYSVVAFAILDPFDFGNINIVSIEKDVCIRLGQIRGSLKLMNTPSLRVELYLNSPSTDVIVYIGYCFANIHFAYKLLKGEIHISLQIIQKAIIYKSMAGRSFFGN